MYLEKLDIPAIDYTKGVRVENPDGVQAKEFILPKELLEAECVISLSKMKTHALERITGAVKNSYGFVYGKNKAIGHTKYPSADSFARMLDSETARRFVSESLQVPEACRACEYYPLCRNGCRRDRLTSGELAGRNAYCEAYRRFFEARYPALRQAAGLILQMRRGG